MSKSERESLKRQHRTFSWQKHGFQAMRVKGAMKAKGVDTWQDYYEPGEGVGSALQKLQTKKGRAGKGRRASIGIESIRTDEEEGSGGGRRRRQSEQVAAQQVSSAKEPAILERDASAIEAIRDEELFGDVWDVSFRASDEHGRPAPSGRDFSLLQERHDQRSERAKGVDAVKAAPKTRDPIKWAKNPNQYDYPGIDTVDPEKVHAGRSDRAKAVDESKSAPLASSVEEWADDPSKTDLLGIDSPQGGTRDVSPRVDTGKTAMEPDPLDVGSGSRGGSDPMGDIDDALAGREEALDIDDDLSDVGPV